MAAIAIVVEILHDGNFGKTLLAKDVSLIEMQKSIIHNSGCESVQVLCAINNRNAIRAFEELIEVNLDDVDKTAIDIGHILSKIA
ncbi:hypothetical protein [Mesorhizobium japonicum]|uniref:hypothetical protein n=1 Tax=Mesorhizobium japonicum TaxID=2066070 RepID=UPI003B59FEBB